MHGISIWHWPIVLVYAGFYFLAVVRILNRVGFSGWWSLLALVPIGNVVALFIFSRAKWPQMEKAAGVFD
ncbi:MAG: hypothetical protein JO357_10035 [Hyphomicrobiales bacterium]|nr:hypothetical protein [Hyphomicrobiales bacterium]MBV9589618.1 hypothetical protein [Hyphomicrobiales bacterium]MBV9753290.1 hypothetical protein [Hyphomicrobiales bacterium]